MTELLGRHHPLIRRLRALGRDVALRRSEGVYIAEGVHLAHEALAEPGRVELFLASPRLTERPQGRELLHAIEQSGIPCRHTSDSVCDGLQDARSPQPVLTLVRGAPLPGEALIAGARDPALLLAAHEIQDPGNLGALLRTAEAAGASGCFVCGRSADPYHPRTVRASAGSLLRLPLAETPVEELLALAAGAGLVTIGAEATGGTPYDRSDLTRPLVLLVGGEGAGLPEDVLAELDETIGVPMRPPVESLSVAAAAAVLLFEAARQRSVR